MVQLPPRMVVELFIDGNGMPTASEAILSCIMRSLCCRHGWEFSAVHDHIEEVGKILNSLPVEHYLIATFSEIFPPQGKKTTRRLWIRFHEFLYHDPNGAQFLHSCSEWPEYAFDCTRLCPDCRVHAYPRSPQTDIVCYNRCYIEMRKGVNEPEEVMKFMHMYHAFLPKYKMILLAAEAPPPPPPPEPAVVILSDDEEDNVEDHGHIMYASNPAHHGQVHQAQLAIIREAEEIFKNK